jgi:hypothetical protein
MVGIKDWLEGGRSNNGGVRERESTVLFFEVRRAEEED